MLRRPSLSTSKVLLGALIFPQPRTSYIPPSESILNLHPCFDFKVKPVSHLVSPPTFGWLCVTVGDGAQAYACQAQLYSWPGSSLTRTEDRDCKESSAATSSWVARTLIRSLWV